MKIAYVLYNERPDAGLIKTQVVALLKEVKMQDPLATIDVIAFWQPWVVLKYKRELYDFQVVLETAEIKLINIAFAFPSRYVFYNATLLKIALSISLKIFKSCLGHEYDIVHSRGYFSSVVVAILKKQGKVKHSIFDMRSLFPEENLAVGRLKKDSNIYRLWKAYEYMVLSNSDFSICVSQPMLDDVVNIDRNAKIALIPCCVDMAVFRFDKKARNDVRQQYNLNERFIVIYIGSLGVSFWNDIHNYAKCFQLMCKNIPNAFFVVLTPSLKIDFSTIFAQYGINASSYLVKKADPSAIHKWLSSADVGLQVMSASADSHTRLGVKFVEYLACGLPVIVNVHAGGATSYVNDGDLGVVVDLDDEEEFSNKTSQLQNKLDSYRSTCVNFAYDKFSTQSCAKQYLNIYKQILS